MTKSIDAKHAVGGGASSPHAGGHRRNSVGFNFRKRADEKIAGLGSGAAARHAKKKFFKKYSLDGASTHETILQTEERARDNAESRPMMLFFLGGIAAIKVFAFYLITMDSVLGCALTVGSTLLWYYLGDEIQGSTLDWVVLGFVVVMPMSATIGMSFARRERALVYISTFRSFAFQIYVAHTVWDWGDDNDGRRRAQDLEGVDWVKHGDCVLEQLVGIGDELGRFLTLPTTSRSRHRMTLSGRHEAAQTVEAAYRLLNSLLTKRFTVLTKYVESLKKAGMPATEASRIRQYERFMGGEIEKLRMIKMYRTPQALRSFARLFTVLLPPLYGPFFAQVARDVNLPLAMVFAIVTSLGLTALFESIQVLEDPFVGYLTLDGINVQEEFNVLHWHQLVNARRMNFPSAPPFPDEAVAEVHYPVGNPPAASDHSSDAAMDVETGHKRTHSRTSAFSIHLDDTDLFAVSAHTAPREGRRAPRQAQNGHQ